MSAAIAALIKSFARPVTRGLLPIEHAEAAVVVALTRDKTVNDINDGIRLWTHILWQCIRNAEDQRTEARGAIKHSLRGLIRLRTPWPRMMAEAHDINGAQDFPLTESEVADVVKTEVYYALPAAPRRPRHGR